MQHTLTRLQQGFTLIEILIISPIVILFIGAFIGLIVGLTGESIKLQESNAAAYNIQDALDDIEATTTQAAGYLITTGPVQAPQGKDNLTTQAFTNTTAGQPDTLIVNVAATTKGPYDSNRALIYTGTATCGTASEKTQPLYTYNVVYFISSNTLYKRTIMKAIPACAQPWQKASCSESAKAANPGVCKVTDEVLLDNVSAMNVTYYANGSASSFINTDDDGDDGDSEADTALSVAVSLTFSKQVAGDQIQYTGSTRSTIASPQEEDESVADITPSALPSIGAPTYTPHAARYSWTPIGSASGYNIRYRAGSSTWVNGPQNTTATSFTINAERRQNVDIEVTVISNSGNYIYDTVYATFPDWHGCPYTSPWGDYGGSWPGADYTITSADVLMMRGLAAGGAANTVICTLPAGYRPSERLIFQAQTYGGTAARVDVLPNGQVINVNGSSTWVDLYGINFIVNGAETATKNLTGSSSWVYYDDATPGVGYSNVQLKQDSLGRAHLQGLGKSGTITSGTTAYSDFTGGYAFTETHIFPAMHHGNAPSTFQTSGNSIVTRGGMAGNSFWSLQALLYPTGSASWQALTMNGNWTNYGSGHAVAAVTKSSDNITSLKGLIRDATAATTTTAIASGTVMATIPSGYRPNHLVMCSIITNSNVEARIDIGTTGQIVAREGIVAGYVSLAGCDYISD